MLACEDTPDKCCRNRRPLTLDSPDELLRLMAEERAPLELDVDGQNMLLIYAARNTQDAHNKALRYIEQGVAALRIECYTDASNGVSVMLVNETVFIKSHQNLFGSVVRMQGRVLLVVGLSQGEDRAAPYVVFQYALTEDPQV